MQAAERKLLLYAANEFKIWKLFSSAEHMVPFVRSVEAKEQFSSSEVVQVVGFMEKRLCGRVNANHEADVV